MNGPKAGKKPLATEVAEDMKNLPMLLPSNLQVAAQAALQMTVKAMEGVRFHSLPSAFLVTFAHILNSPFDNGGSISESSSRKKVRVVLVRTYANFVYLSVMDVVLPVDFKYESIFNARCD